MAKKKILIFSLAYKPFIGGAELAIKEITNRIGDEFLFDMITLRFDTLLPRYEKIGNVTVYRIGFSKKKPADEELIRFPLYLVKVFYPLLAFFKAIKLYHKNQYDMFWAVMAYAGFPVALFRLFYRRVPYLLTIQEGDSIDYMTKRWRIRVVSFLFKRIFRDASLIQVISKYLGEYARSMGFKGEVVVVPNGVNIKNFISKISDFEKLELRKKLKIQESDKIIITTSRLVSKNAIDDAIKSLKYLPTNVKFLILGTGPDELILKNLVKENSLKSRVFFFGHIPYNNLPLYYKTADIFMRPSLSEGMGSSFVEAMAAGTPIIGTSVGGIPDFLRDGETGFVCRVRDPKHIAQKVSYILDPQNRDHIERVKKEAMKIVLLNHDWDKNAEKMRQLFNQIL